MLGEMEVANGPIMNRYAFWSWCGIGCLAFIVDDVVQPAVASIGRNDIIRPIAELWQQIAETGGIVTFVAVLLILGRDYLKPALLTLVGVGAVAQCGKYLLGRVRPHWTGDVTVFHGPLGMWTDGPRMPVDSMPSGHTAVAFAMAQVLAAQWPRANWFWMLLACGVAVSRTLVDVHFPSDVIFGGLLGTLIGRWALNVTCARVAVNETNPPTASMEITMND